MKKESNAAAILGRKGGRARAKSLSTKQIKAIARKGGLARQAKSRAAKEAA